MRLYTSIFLFFLTLSFANLSAAQSPSFAAAIVAQTIEKLLTQSQAEMSGNDQRPIEIDLKVKQIEPRAQRYRFRAEELVGSISIPLKNKIEIIRPVVANQLLGSISPSVSIEPLDELSTLKLSFEKIDSRLRASLNIVRVENGIEYWSGVRLNTRASLANYGTILLQSVNLNFDDFDFDKDRAKFSGNCLLHMYVKGELEKIDCHIDGELDVVKMAYKVHVNISPADASPDCQSISNISEHATKIFREYQLNGAPFPSMYTLIPKVEMQASTMNGEPQVSRKGLYEGFVRLGEGNFEFIPGFRIDSDTRTLIYICAKYEDENSRKPIATLYFLRLPKTGSSVLKFFRGADADQKVVIASRNISFRPMGYLTSTVSKVFSKIPVFNLLLSSFNKVVTFGEDQLFETVISDSFQLGVSRLDITTESIEFFYGARVFENETEASRKTIYFK